MSATPQPTPAPKVKKCRSKLSALPATEQTAMLEALHQLNNEVCLVFDLNRVAILPTAKHPKLNLVTFDAFVYNLYAHWQIAGISVADEWRKWPKRRTVNSIVYEPGKEIFTPEGNYNEWRSSGLVPKKGDLAPFWKLLDHLFSNDLTYKDWFIAWMAYPIIFPGTKLHTACVFWSTMTGTGKSTIGYILKHLYGKHNYHLLNDADLTNQFNAYAACKQIVEGEEMRGGSNARKNSDTFKSMITRHEVTVNEKHKAQYTVRDCINYYFTSNHSDALYLEEYDRRFFVHAIPNIPLPASFFLDELQPWLLNGGGLEAILYYFLHELDIKKPIVGGSGRSVDPSPFRPGECAPQSNARHAMILESMDDAEAWAWNLRNYPENYPTAKWHTLFTVKELIYLYRTEYPKEKMGDQQLSRRFRANLVQVGAGNPVLLDNGRRERLLSTKAEHEHSIHAQLKAVFAQEFEKSGAIVTEAE